MRTAQSISIYTIMRGKALVDNNARESKALHNKLKRKGAIGKLDQKKTIIIFLFDCCIFDHIYKLMDPILHLLLSMFTYSTWRLSKQP